MEAQISNTLILLNICFHYIVIKKYVSIETAIFLLFYFKIELKFWGKDDGGAY